LFNSQNSAEIALSAALLGPADARASLLCGPAAKETSMPTYVTLSNFSDQGMKGIKDTVKRSEAFRKAAKEAGVTVKEILWTQGQYDVVTIVEGPDEIAMAAMGLSNAKMGNISGQTLRAFTAAEMEKILAKVS
jgi:uncharacterized protein with GYD domain